MKVDGRSQRSVRTREAILQAHVRLLRQGNRRPTAKEIAGEAGVSPRTLWVAFDDLEELFASTVAYWVGRDRQLTRPIDGRLPLASRVDAYADQRARRLGNLAPAARAASANPGSPTLIRGRALFLGEQRAQLAEVFAPELARSEDPELLLDGLVAVSSWNFWSVLRDDRRRSAADCRAIMASALHGLLCTPDQP